MGFGGLGMWEIILIFLVVLLLFGAKRLPEIGASLGKGIREFKGSVRDIENEINRPSDRDTISSGNASSSSSSSTSSSPARGSSESPAGGSGGASGSSPAGNAPESTGGSTGDDGAGGTGETKAEPGGEDSEEASRARLRTEG